MFCILHCAWLAVKGKLTTVIKKPGFAFNIRENTDSTVDHLLAELPDIYSHRSTTMYH